MQKFQKAGAKKNAPNSFRGYLYLSGMYTKKKNNMAAMTKDNLTVNDTG